MAAQYAWTLRYHGREAILKVTSAQGLEEVLRILDLPGRTSVDYIVKEVEASELGTFSHNCGHEDEWSLAWTRLDDRT